MKKFENIYKTLIVFHNQFIGFVQFCGAANIDLCNTKRRQASNLRRQIFWKPCGFSIIYLKY